MSGQGHESGDHHKDVMCPACSPSITRPYPGTEGRQTADLHHPDCTCPECMGLPTAGRKATRSSDDPVRSRLEPTAGREATLDDVPEVVDAYREVGCTCGDEVIWCPLHTPSPEATRTKPMPDHLAPPARTPTPKVPATARKQT